MSIPVLADLSGLIQDLKQRHKKDGMTCYIKLHLLNKDLRVTEDTMMISLLFCSLLSVLKRCSHCIWPPNKLFV